MKNRLISWWEDLREGFWFIPSLMLAGSIGLSFVTVAFDQSIDDDGLKDIAWVFAISPEGSRSLLTTVAGSMITIAGVIFSITILTLTMASSQFGPRLLKNFRRSAGNQVVLGTFIATFTYSILVLRTVGSEGEQEFVPHFSILVSVLLSIISMSVLVYFIHHTAVILQASSIVETVFRDLQRAVDRLYPETEGPGLPHDEGRIVVPADFEQKSKPVPSGWSGFVQSVDLDWLTRIASERDVIFRIETRPGRFASEGAALVRFYDCKGKNASPDTEEELGDTVRGAFVLGPERQHPQDIEFSIEQLVEIAVRALSPSLNDPFTALACLERLNSAFCRLAKRRIPSAYRCGPEGELRLIAPRPSFEGMLDCGFNQIRQYGRGSASVVIRMLETLREIAHCTELPERRQAVFRHASMVSREAMRSIEEEGDRKDIQHRYQRLCDELNHQGLSASYQPSQEHS